MSIYWFYKYLKYTYCIIKYYQILFFILLCKTDSNKKMHFREINRIMHTINSNVYMLRVLNSNHYCISKCISTTSAFAPTNIALAHTTRITSYFLSFLYSRESALRPTRGGRREKTKMGGGGGAQRPRWRIAWIPSARCYCCFHCSWCCCFNCAGEEELESKAERDGCGPCGQHASAAHNEQLCGAHGEQLRE
jgi:hypothetical protein